jgi:hypothetical protein
MKPSEAKELSHLLARVGGLLNQSAAFVRDHDTEANFIEYRTVIGKLMGDLFLDAMTPLYKRFPDLLPDYLGGPYKIPESAYMPLFYDTTIEHQVVHVIGQKKEMRIDEENRQEEQDSTGRPSTRPVLKSEGGDKLQPEAEGHSR